jgi:tetratricopeptide (TPR) repeat protein
VEDRFPGLTLAAENLAGSRDNPAAAWPALLQPRMALPPVLPNRFRDEPHGMEQVMDALEVADEYLEAVYLCGTDPLRRLIVVLLSYRCKAHQDPAAADLLRRFARLPIGTDDLRMSMLTSLRASGLAAGDEYLDYWHGSRLTQARGLGIEVHREPEPTGLSPDLERMFQDAFAAFADGRNEEAEQGLRAILTRAPAQPAVLANLGGILDVAGRRREAKALLRQALDVDPDYLFARCTLARLLIDEGDVAGAEALLPEIDAFERLHVQHLIALFGTTALLHAARGDAEAARGLLDVVQSVVADDDERRRLAHYQLTAGRLARDPSFMTELIKEHVSRGSGSGIQ